ncbi:hypothetical protein M3148_03785 [Georgenia satyanarayanai]|uniref:hypothetical protein n=1 Tax=Georgenia satyanarayanai TaxID=860221 RepID=UPI0020418145|nr:hypothetical protein [Georgenia satyanarayanai]MCM3660117.1 hypothetical protein [Georgenia satyanarayanai]
MTQTVVVLTEDTLLDTDVAQIVETYAGRDVRFEVLVPADTEHNVLQEVVNDLGLLDLRRLWHDITTRDPDDRGARTEAAEALRLSLALLEVAGMTADGVVVADDPLPALSQAVANHRAVEVVVVTTPKLLDDTLRRDWASRAREALGVPVLHLYTGSSIVG